jgi:tripartite-type tricarboxylate transporter receptor subunit TctC
LGAESAEQFYQGKTITWVASGRPGSSADLLGRVLAPFLKKETGAQVKVEAMGSNKSANYVYDRVKLDGLTLLCRDTASLKLSGLLKAPGARWDIGKYNWLADILPQKLMFGVSPKLSDRSLKALRAAPMLKAGGTSARGGMVVTPSVMFEVFGLKGKVISGYQGVKGVARAAANGEVDVVAGNSETTALKNQEGGNIIYIFAIGSERSALFPDSPATGELGLIIPKNAQHAYNVLSAGTGKAIATSPGVPEDRVAYLRKVFDKLMKNPEVKKEREKFAKDSPKYIPGEKLQADMVNIVTNKTLASELQAIIEKFVATK